MGMALPATRGWSLRDENNSCGGLSGPGAGTAKTECSDGFGCTRKRNFDGDGAEKRNEKTGASGQGAVRVTEMV